MYIKGSERNGTIFEKSEKLLTSRAAQFFSTCYLSFLSFSSTKCQIQLQNQNQKAKWILTVILESIRTNLYVDLGWHFSTFSSELQLSLFIYLDQRFLALLSVCLSQSYCYYHQIFGQSKIFPVEFWYELHFISWIAQLI